MCLYHCGLHIMHGFFLLAFQMEVPDGDPVLLWDNIIEKRLSWDGVELEIAPMEWDIGMGDASDLLLNVVVAS